MSQNKFTLIREPALFQDTKDEPVQNDAPIYLKYYYLYDYRGKMQSSTHNPDAMFSAPVFESLSELLIPRRYVMLCIGLMLKKNGVFFLLLREIWR